MPEGFEKLQTSLVAYAHGKMNSHVRYLVYTCIITRIDKMVSHHKPRIPASSVQFKENKLNSRWFYSQYSFSPKSLAARESE